MSKQQQELEDSIDRIGQSVLRLKDERDRYKLALELISAGQSRPEEIARIALDRHP